MIGIYAILFDVAFVALGGFLLVCTSWLLVDSLRRKKPANVFHKNDRDDTSGALCGVVIMLLWLGVLSNRILREIRLHSDLSHLRPDIVERIEIGNHAVTDKRQIAEIIDALNHADWFALQRGDVADKVSFAVRLTSGRLYNYEAARYLRGEGAALISRSPSGWYDGEAFCVRLPASLKNAEITLPDCYGYYGKPERCAVQ
jgi:hypothetical protein